ncbi:MAG TPA: glycosyltransferase [Candidatus Acidoferrales bacterium]|nr:glycosyltransferase [Candidatus Acidoferrales bacterium]
MAAVLEDYVPIVGEGVVSELRLLGERLAGKRVLNVNSTKVGGGVAEILSRLVPLLSELGIDARWEVLHGTEDFFVLTKNLHNALHGAPVTFGAADRQVYNEVIEMNLASMDLDADFKFIHDPQPAGLVKSRAERGGHWMWRCHIDVSAPAPGAWEFIAPMVAHYDLSVFSAPQFARTMEIPQVLIAPSIDPLSDKNRELSRTEIESVLTRFGIHSDKPIVSQISRFDRLKDPVGVIKAWKMVKSRYDCQLVLAGGGATDDPEGAAVLKEVREQAGDDPDVFILDLPPTSNVEINALQRASTVVVQKSLKEGFGLTVSEALWKGRPVIASAVGGIPLQVSHKYSGILTHTIEGTAFWIKQLLSAPDFAQKLGANGHHHVRENFLLTRHMRDYMLTFLFVADGKSDIIRL